MHHMQMPNMSCLLFTLFVLKELRSNGNILVKKLDFLTLREEEKETIQMVRRGFGVSG